MVEYKDCKREDLIADAKTDSKKKEWLKEYVKTPLKNKKGEDRKPTFFEMKRAYYTKFFPELLPAKADRKTIFELIDEL